MSILVAIVFLLASMIALGVLAGKLADDVGLGIMVAALSLVALIPLTIIGLKMTTGGVESYSVGVTHGVLSGCSTEGLIWKTNECNVFFTGADGEQAGMVKRRLSVPDHILPEVLKATSKRAVFETKCWLFMPYRVGDSGCEVTRIQFEEVPGESTN